MKLKNKCQQVENDEESTFWRLKTTALKNENMYKENQIFKTLLLFMSAVYLKPKRY